jgi:MFS family permease
MSAGGNAHDQVNDQAAHDNNGKGPLRIRPDCMRGGSRQQTQRCNQHGHHDRPQSMLGLPVASIVGAPISGLILDHVHWLAISSWRWVLILEGLPAIVAGMLTYVLLPSRPEEAKFLSAAEKAWIATELAQEERKKLDKHQPSVIKIFAHGRVWHLASILFTFAAAQYAITFWMPQALKALYSSYSTYSDQ